MYSRPNSIAQQATENIRVIQSFTLEEIIQNRFHDLLDSPLKSNLRHSHLQGLVTGASFLGLYSSYGTILYYGTVLLSRGEINAQQLFSAGVAIFEIGIGKLLSDVVFVTRKILMEYADRGVITLKP